MNDGAYTLGDLLNEPGVGLELLSGGTDALLVPVAGVHAIELEHPAKWIDSGWMMLTMGVRLRNKPQVQRELVAELQELGASCLGFGVGLSFKAVPPALLDEATRRNFPIVLVPEETQFRDITRAVFQSTVGIESTTFQRLTSIQQYLLRAFTEDNPLQSIVHRLGRLVHATVAVMSFDGRVEESTGKLPISEIAQRLAGQANSLLAEFDEAEWRILGVPVDVSRGPSARWLIVASRRTAVTHELARAAVQVTAPLIDALLRMNVTNQGQDRAIRRSVLDSAIDDVSDVAGSRALGARFNALGIDFGGDIRSIIIRERVAPLERPASEMSRQDVIVWLHERLDGAAARYLLSERAAEVVLVAEWSSGLAAVLADLVERWPTASVGVGRRACSVADVRISHRDAQIAVQHLNIQLDTRIMRFDDLDVVTQLLSEVPPERFAATAAPIVAMLAENPIQLEALRAFFAMNRDVKAAAESIFLHPNTLRYRLERLEQTLGRSLREPAVTASLYCVLMLMDDLSVISTDTAVPAERSEDRTLPAPAPRQVAG